MKTKRGILGLFLALCVVWSMLPLGAFAAENIAEVGKGTAESPYQISSTKELEYYRGLMNEGADEYRSAHYALTADIDLNPGCTYNPETNQWSGSPSTWTPIGTENAPFTGTFDGNGHSITGLYINNADSDNQGLFGYMSGTNSAVRNLTVSGTVSVSGIVRYVGGVVGWNNGGIIENCSYTGSVSGYGVIGGVVGDNNGGTVEKCTAENGSVSGDNNVGGVVGYNSSGGTVTNCYNTGTVNGSSQYVGGVVGSSGSTVTNCYNTGTVKGSAYIVGGVVGGIPYGTVENCYNTGTVNGSSYVGGVIGWSVTGSGTVENCYYLEGTADIGIGDGLYTGNGAQPLTEENFANKNSFPSDWFTSTWEMSELLGRPILQSNREGGSGTPESPYEIPDLATLERARDLINDNTTAATYRGASYVLTADIDMLGKYGEGEGKDSWTPIGSFSNAFTGTFDGQGHSIMGLYVYVSEIIYNHYQGLFGYVGEGTVKNLTISGNVSGAANNSVGGVVGYNNGGTIENCKFEGSIRGGNLGGTVGGVVGGNANGTVKNCSNTGKVSGTDTSAGGVVGENSGTVTNCHNNAGTVSGDDNPAGGVVGANSGTVENCSNTGKVSGTGGMQAPAGGVVGENDSGTVKNCSNTGEVNGTGVPAGGVVGWNIVGTVTNCSNTGTVSGSNNAGGVVGENRERHRRKLLQYRQGQRRGLCRWCGRRE